ncbi:MAG TPA: hypothetical protein VFG33_37455 [Kribbella sp.]|uniref:hypothetical protein n=1 Tax=Kribbella sp. TaxID=1871183 RepID=UPI002D784E8C|nr:hypothetical protein [Kribbella sp.]HET6299117.1 hypothetical protein [Kribbella sp.]
MSDSATTDALVNADLSAMTPPEMLAHLDAVELRLRQLRRDQLQLLEGSPEVVAQHPSLQELLDHLRTSTSSVP